MSSIHSAPQGGTDDREVVEPFPPIEEVGVEIIEDDGGDDEVIRNLPPIRETP